MKVKTIVKCADGLLCALRTAKENTLPLNEEDITQLSRAFRLTHLYILYLVLDALEDRQKAAQLVRLFDALAGETVLYNIALAAFADLLDRKFGIRKEYRNERKIIKDAFKKFMFGVIDKIATAQGEFKECYKTYPEEKGENVMFY